MLLHHIGMATLEQLQTLPLLANLGRHALREIAGTLAMNTWPAHHRIVGPRATHRRFWIILDGHVKIVRSNSDGREFTVWLLGTGDGFDYASLLDGKPHAVSAWTLDPAITLSAPLAAWQGWIERYPPLRLAVYRHVSAKLRELTETASDLALHDTTTRLALLLLRHLDTDATHSAHPIDPLRDLSQDELASLIGTVRIVVNRSLAKLREEGILSLHGRHLRIANLQRLLQRAEGRIAPTRARQISSNIATV